ncbi:MAG: ATPase [Spirochaetaceae bacterium]|jgi:vacuolar-type H+-ATPase subunit E/Vma4|nr:ATPase [Spirochaetaceae bacterium]
MEELQSTEVLDREILEDARKKAFKILKSADDSVAASKALWERKLQKTLEQARMAYAKKAEQSRREIMVKLPLDKRRIRSERIETLLNEAMRGFLASLDRDTLLRILGRELAERAAALEDETSGPGELRCRDLSSAELSALGSETFPGAVLKAAGNPLHTESGAFPAVVVDFPRLRITASVDNAARDLLQDKRAELAEALLGEVHD